MSNPTTHTEQFNGSIGGFTGSAPIRYDSGLWLEEAGANLFTNPVAGTGAGGFSAFANRVVQRTTSLPAPLPGWLASEVTTGFFITAGADIGPATVWSTSNFTLTDVAHQGAVFIYVPTAFSATGMALRFVNYTSATAPQVAVNMALRDQWQLVHTSIDPDAGDLVGNLSLFITAGTWLTGETIYFTCIDIAASPYLTSHIDGALNDGDGYDWNSTAHASTSTRAASSASISPAGILIPDSGSLAFRLTRKIDTAAEELYGECGQKASGKDHLRWGVDASDHPFCEWSSNNAAYQRLTGTETISVNTEYLFYLGWNGVLTELSIDAGTKHTGTRAAVSNSWGAGNLKLEAA